MLCTPGRNTSTWRLIRRLDPGSVEQVGHKNLEISQKAGPRLCIPGRNTRT
jgi:hypothetical protein